LSVGIEGLGEEIFATESQLNLLILKVRIAVDLVILLPAIVVGLGATSPLKSGSFIEVPIPAAFSIVVSDTSV